MLSKIRKKTSKEKFHSIEDFKKSGGKLVFIITALMIIQLFAVLALASKAFFNYKDYVIPSFTQLYTSTEKEALEVSLKMVKSILDSKYEEFSAGSWREELKTVLSQILWLLGYICKDVKNRAEVRERVRSLINSLPVREGYIFLISKERVIYANCRCKNESALLGLYEMAKGGGVRKVELTVSVEDSLRGKSLIGYISLFRPSGWVIGFFKDKDLMFFKYRNSAVRYLRRIYLGEESALLIRDEIDGSSYFVGNKELKSKFYEVLDSFPEDESENEGEMTFSDIHVKYLRYAPFRFKIFIAHDFSKGWSFIAEKAKECEKYVLNLWNSVVTVGLFISAVSIVLELLYLRKVWRVIESMHADLSEALYNQKVFLASVSHELRTPLNGIIGFLDLLKDTSLDERQRTFVEEIETCSQQLLNLVNDVLDASKIQAGQMELLEEEFDFEKTLEEIVLVLGSSKRPEVDLRLRHDQKIPYYLVGDSRRVKQIFYNLVSNALKFTLKGKVEVGIERLEETDDGSIKVVSYVKDTGIGISPENQKRLFAPFFRVETELGKEVGGTGLGLYISRKLAQAMEGDIWVESEEGKGSTFYVELKFKKGRAKGEAISADKEESFAKWDFSKLRVLVAEDVLTNQRLIKMVLKNFFNIEKIDFARNGKEAVEKALRNEYDIILMDLKMPLMDGLEATKQLRSRGINIPIFMLTADAYKETEVKSKRAGADGFLIKPLDRNELKKALELAYRRSKFS